MSKHERGELIPVRNIYKNRLNPNEMDRFDVDQLEKDVKVDDYDPITVSPLDVFYTAKARMDPRVLEIIPADADPEKVYIICDGYHRHTAASRLGLTHIRAVIRHMTEADAMPHFYRRHKLRGKLNPIKEAELFRSELERGLTRAELVKLYNLSSVSYIETRLSLLNVTTDIAELFWEPPEDLPGRLTTEHLRSLSRIPKNIQFAVAMMSLERNWRVEDIRAEVRRIREGQGIRSPGAEIEAPDAPPSSHPTMAQSYLHPNIDRLLKPNEEKVIRFIKLKGEASRADIFGEVNISSPPLKRLLDEMIELEVLESTKEDKKGHGRRKQIFRLVDLDKPKPKSQYARDTPLTDEDILRMYPDDFKKTITDDATTVKERMHVPSGVFKEGRLNGMPRVEPESTDAWKEHGVGRLRPIKEEAPVVVKPLPEPPLVLNQGLIEDFAEAIYEMAIKEGFNIKGKELIDGQEPGRWLENEIGQELDAWSISKELRSAIKMGLRACQLYHRHREM